MGLSTLSCGVLGYTNTRNIKNFTIDELMDRLSNIKVSFGTPIMTDINGNRSVMYKDVTGKFDIFARINKGKVILGRIVSDDVIAAKKLSGQKLDRLKDKGTSIVNRAVSELLQIVKKLEASE